MEVPPFKLERYFAKHEFDAQYLLCCSDCESMSIGDLLELGQESEQSIKDVWLGYTESQGDPELREEISKLYSTVNSSQVLVHTGAEEPIFNCMNAILKPGDHVIALYPCYQSLTQIAESIGCEVTYWKLENCPNWRLDFDYFVDQIKSNTKLVILNSPHNPTGFQFSGEEFNTLSELSNKHGFYIFSDEVYRYLEYDEEDRLPSICDINENALALGVMSKTFGLAGLRIGWIASQNRKVYEKLAAFKDYTTICNSAPSEFLSIVALKNRGKLIQRNLNIIKSNLKLLNDFFKRHSHLFAWNAPKAGPIAFPELKIGNTTEFCHDLLTKAGVLLLPGTLYDESYNNFRIGFGRLTMEKALNRFDDYLQ